MQPLRQLAFIFFYVNCSQVLILHFDYLELYFALCFPCEPMSPQEVSSLRHGVENQISMMLLVLLMFSNIMDKIIFIYLTVIKLLIHFNLKEDSCLDAS